MNDINNAKPLAANSLLNNQIAANRLQGARMSSSAPRTYVPSSRCNVRPQGQVQVPQNVANAFNKADLAAQEAMDVLKG